MLNDLGYFGLYLGKFGYFGKMGPEFGILVTENFSLTSYAVLTIIIVFNSPVDTQASSRLALNCSH